MKSFNLFNLTNDSVVSNEIKEMFLYPELSLLTYKEDRYKYLFNKANETRIVKNRNFVSYEFDDNFEIKESDIFDENLLLKIASENYENKKEMSSDIKGNIEFIIYSAYKMIKDKRLNKIDPFYFNYIKRKLIIPCINNLYNKVKYNTINYTKGEPIRDLYDIIFDQLQTKDPKFTLYIAKKFRKFVKKYVTNTKIDIQRSNISLKDDKYNIEIVGITKDVNMADLVVFKKPKDKLFVTILADLYVLVLFKTLSKDIYDKILSKNKNFKYISNDCEAFFSRMISGTAEIYENYNKAMKKSSNFVISVGDSFNKIGKRIINMFANPYWKRNVSKDKLKLLRENYFKSFDGESNFTDYFGDIVATNSLYNNYHHDITCYNEDAIDQKVQHDENYQKMINSYQVHLDDLIIKTIDLAVNESDKIDTVIDEHLNGNKLYQFIFGYLSVLRHILSKKAIKISNNAISEASYNKDIFINGIIKDMNSTRPFKRLLKRYYKDDIKKIDEITKKFAETIVDNVYNLIIFDVTTIYDRSKDSFMTYLYMINNDYKKLNRDMKSLMISYAYTTASRIWETCYTSYSDPKNRLVSPFVPNNLSRSFSNINK